jgi:hypothetical protein
VVVGSGWMKIWVEEFVIYRKTRGELGGEENKMMREDWNEGWMSGK